MTLNVEGWLDQRGGEWWAYVYGDDEWQVCDSLYVARFDGYCGA